MQIQRETAATRVGGALAVIVLASACSGLPIEEETPRFGIVLWDDPDAAVAHQDFDVGRLVAWNAVVAALRDLGYEVEEPGIVENARIRTAGVDAYLADEFSDFTRVVVEGRGPTLDVRRERAREALEEIGKRLEARYHGRRES